MINNLEPRGNINSGHHKGSDTYQYIKAFFLVFIMSKEVNNSREKEIKEKCGLCKSAVVKAWFRGAGVCIECYNMEKEKWGKGGNNHIGK